MLKRLSKFFDRNSSKKNDGNHRVLDSHEHNLNPKKICKNAREIVRVLQKNNFEAYVVGGCVRDILCNMSPKDFDISSTFK